MKYACIALLLLLPILSFARIPIPGQATQQQANVYGTYTGSAGSWGYNNSDPNLTTRTFGASNSYQQYGAQQQRSSNLMGIGVTLIDVFTSQGTFGEKVKFLLLDQLKRRVTDPLQTQAQAQLQNMTLEQLYALANPGALPANQNYTQCTDCINPNPSSWQPTYTNPHAVGNQFTQFSSNGTNVTNEGLGGVVTPTP